ncbi:MAG: ABC transporter ATP-binding protein [Bifidobacteriaceae bacterium]|jgi:multiple sugar transport system ATP-binding protein|nr:ABC transporter ATP-binding protein [Bifidobacteriaceae bacterium]
MSVSFKNIQKTYLNNSKPVICNLNLKIKEGEFLALTGPSGSGKTTVLRMLAGLEKPTSGEIFMDKKNIMNIPSKDRFISMVFQQTNLYPYMSAAKNISFVLKSSGLAKSKIELLVKDIMRDLELTQFSSYMPSMLSGGQKRRVAIARAMVRVMAKKARIFLLDEPLVNLESRLKTKISLQISALQKEFKITTIYVTHDETEALDIADKIVVLDKGILQR